MLSTARTSATASSAAADGVGARRSATKSMIVVSVSWPTAEITGVWQEKRHALLFLIERPKILDRTASAAHDQHIQIQYVQTAYALHDAVRRSLSLHQAG